MENFATILALILALVVVIAFAIIIHELSQSKKKAVLLKKQLLEEKLHEINQSVDSSSIDDLIDVDSKSRHSH